MVEVKMLHARLDLAVINVGARICCVRAAMLFHSEISQTSWMDRRLIQVLKGLSYEIDLKGSC